MPNIPLSIFRSPGEVAPSGRLRSVIERVPETTPNAAFSAAGTTIAEAAEAAGRTIGSALSQFLKEQKALKEKEQEATDLTETSKAYDARVNFFEEGRTKLLEQKFDSTDAARAAYAELGTQARSIGAENVQRVSKPAAARLESRFDTYVRSATVDGVRDAYKRVIERKRGEVVTHLDNQERLYFAMSDSDVRDNILLNMLETVDRAGETVFAPDDAAKLKTQINERTKMGAGREFVGNTPFLAAITAIDESKGVYTPEQKDTLIGVARTRAFLIEQIQRKSEIATEKAEAKRRNLNESAFNLKISQAIRADRPNDLVALSAQLAEAVQVGDIDPEREISFQTLITTALTRERTERPVRNDQQTAATLLEMRLNHDPRLGSAAVAAARSGKLTVDTANGFVGNQLSYEDATQYFNNEVYKQRRSSLAGQMQSFVNPAFSAMAAKIPFFRDGISRIQNEAKTAFDRDVAGAQRAGLSGSELEIEIERIYETTINRFKPALDDLNKGPKPRTKSVAEAATLFLKDPRDRARFNEEFVALTLSGALDNVILSPENTKWRDEIKEEVKRGFSR